VLLVDTLESRLARGAALGVDTLQVSRDESLVDAAREWAGGDGPEVVIEASGVAGLVQPSVELVTHEFELERTAEAMQYAMSHPAEVMKAVVRLP
jgi:threonine dehydrogenase-like Zn-dependent dehydrogenase